MIRLWIRSQSVAGCVPRRSLPGGVQRFEERHERRGFRRIQVLAIGRHVAAALNHLPDELILGELYGNCIERGPALTSGATQGVAIVTLLRLEHERSLP